MRMVFPYMISGWSITPAMNFDDLPGIWKPLPHMCCSINFIRNGLHSAIKSYT
jgi:hypothetical protein